MEHFGLGYLSAFYTEEYEYANVQYATTIDRETEIRQTTDRALSFYLSQILR